MTEAQELLLTKFMDRCLSMNDESWQDDLFFHINRYKAFESLTNEQIQEFHTIFPWNEYLPGYNNYVIKEKLQSGCLKPQPYKGN